MVEIKTSYLIIGLILGPIVIGSEQITGDFQSASVVRSQRKQEQANIRHLQDKASLEADLSRLALTRVQGPCVPLKVESSENTPVRLDEGTPVVNALGQSLNNGIGCTELGDTADIVNGKARNIARISPTDRAEYFEYFDMHFERDYGYEQEGA